MAETRNNGELPVTPKLICSVCIATLFSLLCVAPAVHGDENEDKGLAIAQEMKARDRGWVDSSARLVMILRNRSGQETTREMRVLALEVQDDGDKSMTIFDTPNDVKGTAFLSYTHATEPDDQWLWLPALKRVKRISSKNKSGPFMGSEFAYEDLSSFEIAKYRYRWLRDEEFDGQACFVIETFPVDEFSGYTRQVVWIDQAEYRPLKIDFYDRKDALLKTLTLTGYQIYLDAYWRPGNQSMVNHQNGKSTDLMMQDYQFQTGLDESDFTENSLKRAR